MLAAPIPTDLPAPREPADAGSPYRSARRWYRAMLVLVPVGLAIVWLALRFGTSAPSIERPAALTVTLATPQVELWDDTVVASGAIAPWQEASVGAQVGGFEIEQVRADVGDRVRKGQVLAVLSPDLLRADEAQLVASDAQAQANRKRARSLQAVGAISQQDLLQNVTSARSTAAQLAAIRLKLGYTLIRAPDDGVISARLATLGAVVPVGQELFRLIRQDRLEWRGQLTAEQLAHVKPGAVVALSLPDGRTQNAVVRQTAPTLDDRSRLALVYADIPAGGTARAGMYAQGRIVIGHAPARTIPAPSVVVRDGHDYVMVQGPGATVTRRAVTIGRRQGERVEILQGLGPDERVVDTGAAFLNDGDLVRIAPASGERHPR